MQMYSTNNRDVTEIHWGQECRAPWHRKTLVRIRRPWERMKENGEIKFVSKSTWGELQPQENKTVELPL